MSIMLGNLRTFKVLKNGEKDSENKMIELENKVKEMGYSYEDNCDKNNDPSHQTYHIYDIPRVIYFSRMTKELKELLLSYSSYFASGVGAGAAKED